MVYDLLFRATAQTLRTIAADPKHLGAEIGFIARLHTWGHNLLHHSHLHCVVPGGGLSADGERWIACRPGFFLPVRVLSRLFRRLFLEQLQQVFDAGQLCFFNRLEPLAVRTAFARYVALARQTEWVVYAKRPFGGPQQVLEYLGRYTHRVAISNNLLIDFADGEVTFRWKDYRHASRQKLMHLDAPEFIRRFLLHVLQLIANPAPAVVVPDVLLDYRDRYLLRVPANRYCRQRRFVRGRLRCIALGQIGTGACRGVCTHCVSPVISPFRNPEYRPLRPQGR